MHSAFICEFGTLMFNLAPAERQNGYRSEGKNCYLKQLLPEKGGHCKINFFSIESFDRLEYAHLGLELNFNALL